MTRTSFRLHLCWCMLHVRFAKPPRSQSFSPWPIVAQAISFDCAQRSLDLWSQSIAAMTLGSFGSHGRTNQSEFWDCSTKLRSYFMRWRMMVPRNEDLHFKSALCQPCRNSVSEKMKQEDKQIMTLSPLGTSFTCFCWKWFGTPAWGMNFRIWNEMSKLVSSCC